MCGIPGAEYDFSLSVDYDGENVTMILKSGGKEMIFKP